MAEETKGTAKKKVRALRPSTQTKGKPATKKRKKRPEEKGGAKHPTHAKKEPKNPKSSQTEKAKSEAKARKSEARKPRKKLVAVEALTYEELKSLNDELLESIHDDIDALSDLSDFDFDEF